MTYGGTQRNSEALNVTWLPSDSFYERCTRKKEGDWHFSFTPDNVKGICSVLLDVIGLGANLKLLGSNLSVGPAVRQPRPIAVPELETPFVEKAGKPQLVLPLLSLPRRQGPRPSRSSTKSNRMNHPMKQPMNHRNKTSTTRPGKTPRSNAHALCG